MRKEFQKIVRYKNLKIVIKYQKKGSRVYLNILNYKGENVEFTIDPYLFGLVVSIIERVLNSWDGLLLITGKVGDGKSTLAKCLNAVWEHCWGRIAQLDSIVFTNENFLEFTDKEDNKYFAVLWDEAIQGGSSRESSSNQGKSLLKTLVTRRSKKHFYIVLVDEIKEFNFKLVSRARAWIHVEAVGLKRGYFKCYDDEDQIVKMYWDFKDRRNPFSYERPSHRGTFQNYEGFFFDEKEYEKKKFKETRSIESSDDNTFKKQRDKLMKAVYKNPDHKWTQREIAKLLGLTQPTINSILKGN